MKDKLLLLAKGMAIGIANIIPGVSGGTMAVVLGIYEKLIGAISGAISGKDGGRLRHIVFLFILGIGAVIGIKVFGEVLKWALEEHKAATMMLFMGLILGSLAPVIKMNGMKRLQKAEMAMIAIGVLAVLALGDPSRKEEAKAEAGEMVQAHQTEPGQTPPSQVIEANLPTLAICGFAAGAAMIVPGVSGSLVLLLLGEYYTVILAIHTLGSKNLLALMNELFKGAELCPEALAALSAIKVIIVVGAFAALGVLVFAKIMDTALKKAPSLTHALIIGLVAGSVVALNPGMPRELAPALGAGICLILGALLSHIVATTKKEA